MDQHITTAEIQAGQIISTPETGMQRMGVNAVSHPFAGVRRFFVLDPETGEESSVEYQLGLHRAVVLHEETLARQHYTNVSSEVIEVRLGPRWEMIEPGAEFHYTGIPRPDLANDSRWEHAEHEVFVESSS